MWSSKEATGNEGKKSAELEMGYCPFEHWLGRTCWVGAHGARARSAGWRGRSARGVRQAGRGASGRGAQGVGRARGVQARDLCAPKRAGWAVGCALGALSLFLTQFQLSTVPESILGGNFFRKKKYF